MEGRINDRNTVLEYFKQDFVLSYGSQGTVKIDALMLARQTGVAITVLLSNGT